METILTFTAPCGASVTFSSDAYKDVREAELELRRENMLNTAAQLSRQQRERKPS